MLATKRFRTTAMLAALSAAMLLSLVGGCKEKEKAPEPGLPPMDETEFTGKCKDLLEHVAKVTTPPGAAVVNQVKARVAAKVKAKRCNKGTVPDAELACLMSAKSRPEVDACQKD